jgi:subtilisin-like proprotein convertase family protein
VPKCVPNQVAGGELCDGLDNDCNGTVDDNIPGTGGDCSTGGAGVCGPGLISCQNGVVDCFSLVPASPEICDGLDNDCNGTVDENNPEGGGACDTGQLGACAVGTLNCVQGGLTCTANALAQPELCDGKDNNCDGQVDEGNPGAGQPCSCGGTTVCMGGQFFCQGCTKEVDCNNNKDDDADGAIDCADSQCALGCNANVSPCAPGEKLLVLASTDAPKPIPDVSTISSVITFSETAVVKRVVLQLDINHTWDSDLDIVLKAPDTTSIDVTSDNGSSSDNYTGTIFNDTCPTPIVSGAAPFNGCFSPEAPMSTFVGKALKGTWTLGITDDAGGDSGTLNSWTLAMCVQ